MPLALRLVAGSALLLVGVTLLSIGVLGALSRLRRNRWFGIRTRATMASDAAFVLGHRVAAAPAGAAGVVALVGAAVLLTGADGPALEWIVLAVSVIGSFALTGFAGMVGDRAAATVEPARATTCAGACAGCDLVAGCRPATSPGGHQPQEPGMPLNGPTTSSVTQPP